tara:strand:+ start:333 stop:566 length:234 start_codon:yes stop_codon:yes gene_type:complete
LVKGQAASNDTGVLVMNGIALKANVAGAVVAFRNSLMNGGAALAAVIHGGTLLLVMRIMDKDLISRFYPAGGSGYDV